MEFTCYSYWWSRDESKTGRWGQNREIIKRIFWAFPFFRTFLVSPSIFHAIYGTNKFRWMLPIFPFCIVGKVLTKSNKLSFRILLIVYFLTIWLSKDKQLPFVPKDSLARLNSFLSSNNCLTLTFNVIAINCDFGRIPQEDARALGHCCHRVCSDFPISSCGYHRLSCEYTYELILV